MFKNIYFSLQSKCIERSRRSGLLFQSLILIGIISLFSITGKAQVIAYGADNFPQQIGIGALQIQNSPSAVVEGSVTDIQGTLVRISGGITIETSGAVVGSLSLLLGETNVPLSEVKIGSTIKAAVALPADSAAPLEAKLILVQLDKEAVLNGVLQNIDAAGRAITVLNQKILITDKTAFVKVFGNGITSARKFEKLKTGTPISVAVAFDGEKLIASQVVQIKIKDE